MKKIFLLLVVMTFMGCASSQIPKYLQDKNPYKKRFYANYDQTLKVTRQALKDLGWEIAGEDSPSVYERDRNNDLDEQQLFILTELRQTPMFLGTRYARMNIYLRSKKDVSEIEIRYITINSFLFKDIQSYRNDSAVKRIFAHIEELMESKR